MLNLPIGNGMCKYTGLLLVNQEQQLGHLGSDTLDQIFDAASHMAHSWLPEDV
jgi:hypothetical protein